MAGAKPNVPFVRLAKIVFKKCEVGKNKNIEALAFGSAVCRFNCPVTLCLFLSFILAVSSFRLAGNGLRVGDVALCCAGGKAILLTRCCRQLMFFH